MEAVIENKNINSIIFSVLSADLCSKMHQGLWTKALASQLFTDRTAANCQTRTCSNCSLTLESMSPSPSFGDTAHLCLWCIFINCCACFPNRPEKMAKLPVLLGNLDVTIDNVSPDVASKIFKIFTKWL